MTTGIIVCHCFQDMVSDIEEQAISNIKNLLSSFTGPVLGNMYLKDYHYKQREDVKALIPAECQLDVDLNLNLPNSDHAPGIIENWVKQYNIHTIYIVGFHYNLCLRGVYNACEMASKSLPQVHRNNFHAYVIEECTAILHDDGTDVYGSGAWSTYRNNKIMTVEQYRKIDDNVCNIIKLKDINV